MPGASRARSDVSSNQNASNEQARVNQPAPQAQSGGNVAEYTVSELSGAIKRALEEGFGYVRLRGEISGFRGAHASGHCYFGLKDDKAKIEAVIWKMTYGRLKVKPEEGMEVIVQGLSLIHISEPTRRTPISY